MEAMSTRIFLRMSNTKKSLCFFQGFSLVKNNDNNKNKSNLHWRNEDATPSYFISTIHKSNACDLCFSISSFLSTI